MRLTFKSVVGWAPSNLSEALRGKSLTFSKNREFYQQTALDLSWGHTHNLLVLFLWRTLTKAHLQRVLWDSTVCGDAASSSYTDPTLSPLHTSAWAGRKLGAGWHRGLPPTQQPERADAPFENCETRALWARSVLLGSHLVPKGAVLGNMKVSTING